MGSVIRARAVPSDNALVVLSPGSELSLTDDIARTSVDPDNRSILEALMKSGMPVTDSAIDTIRHFAETYERKDPFFLRLIAILVDKRIGPTGEIVDELLRVFEPPEDEKESEGGGEADARGDTRGYGDGRRDETPPGRHYGDRSDEDTESQIKRSIIDSSKGEATGNNAFQLFNHIVALHDNWQAIPFRVARDEWRANGSIRIRRSGSGLIRSFTVDVVSGNERQRFYIEFDGNTPNRDTGDEGYRPGRAILPKSGGSQREIEACQILSEKLRNMGIEIDDIYRDDVHDGFSNESLNDIGGIDTLV